RDRILLGTREASNVLLPEEKQSVAVHESGHALVAALSPNADPVSKVTILPAGMALGATHQLPEAERHLYSEAYLNDLLAVRLVEKETIDGNVVLEVLHDKRQLVSHASGSAPGGTGGSASSGASGSAPGGTSPASPAGPG